MSQSSPRCNRVSALCTISLLFLSVGQIGSSAQSRKSQRVLAPSARPKLVLLIVADQFRYDYLERFGDLFGANGLRRLLQGGASWVDANYDHVPTNTAPGHATLMTGAYPALTGIIGNEWADRNAARKVTSVSDPDTKLLGGLPNLEGSSPRRLMASTIGDEMRLTTNDRSKVIGISVKDRAAILPAGRHANAAYWLSEKTGTMVSSDYYFKELPNWVASFDAAHPADKFFGAKWERLLPEAEYLKRAGADAQPWENFATGGSNTFPHVITGGLQTPGPAFYEALDRSPYTTDILLSFAKQAIINEKLGADSDTDVLTISFSANDYVGHRFGPYSQEVMDVTLRFDRQLGELLDFVDSRVGLRNTVLVFTADHGVAPPPEQALALGLSGGRLRSTDILGAIRAAISARYDPQGKANPPADYISKYNENGQLRDAFFNGNVYFDRAALRRDGIDPNEVEQLTCEAARQVKGIARCFTRTQLESGGISDADMIGRRVLHGFYSSRSGDIVMVYDAFNYLTADRATHSSPYSLDTHVPLIIKGSGIKPGRYLQAAAPTDIAPTLAALLRIQTPSNSAGRILLEAMH